MDQAVARSGRRARATPIAPPSSTPKPARPTPPSSADPRGAGLVPPADELDRQLAAALARLRQPEPIGPVERQSLVAILGWSRAVLADRTELSTRAQARLDFSENGAASFVELLRLMRLQDAQIVELQAIVAELL